MARTRDIRKLRKHTLMMGVIGTCLLLGVVAGCMWFEQQAKQPEVRGDLSLSLVDKSIVYNDQTYWQRSDLTTILLMGVDQTFEETEQVTFRNGGQADFLLLLVADHAEKVVYQLQIDRDTMTEVETLSVFGTPLGASIYQICLAHGFGADENARSVNTRLAVETLLQMPSIDYFVSIPIDAIASINHLLDGVTVTLEDDFSDLDAQMTVGTTLTLTDEQAALFVRSRMEIGDGTNEERMKRQRQYLLAASEQIVIKIEENTQFSNTLYEWLQSTGKTNIAKGTMINLVDRCFTYSLSPTETLQGTHSIGNDGFVEFHYDAESTFQWMVDHFYQI